MINKLVRFGDVLSHAEHHLFNVYVMYEYSDEFEEDTDENDITWCSIFIRDIRNNHMIQLIDDETA